jgi:hypothetical protein
MSGKEITTSKVRDSRKFQSMWEKYEVVMVYVVSHGKERSPKEDIVGCDIKENTKKVNSLKPVRSYDISNITALEGR